MCTLGMCFGAHPQPAKDQHRFDIGLVRGNRIEIKVFKDLVCLNLEIENGDATLLYLLAQ